MTSQCLQVVAKVHRVWRQGACDPTSLGYKRQQRQTVLKSLFRTKPGEIRPQISETRHPPRRVGGEHRIYSVLELRLCNSWNDGIGQDIGVAELARVSTAARN